MVYRNSVGQQPMKAMATRIHTLIEYGIFPIKRVTLYIQTVTYREDDVEHALTTIGFKLGLYIPFSITPRRIA